MNIEEVSQKFKAARRIGEGYQAICPCHDDNRQSLSINRADNGGVLLYCQVGCETSAVVKAAGLTMADLMPSNGHANGNGQPSNIVATYDYRDENNSLLYQAVRYEPKDFRQRSPKPGGGWNWTTKGIRKVLFRLPELLKADPEAVVFICEGEKDVLRLAKLGLVATCNVGGASDSATKTKWLPEYNQHLSGRKLAILVDNDPAGDRHSRSISDSNHGNVEWSKLIYLPNLPPKGDVSDFMDAGGTKEELLRLVEMTAEFQPGQREPGDELDEPFPAEPSSQYDEPPGGTAKDARKPLEFQRIDAAELDEGEYELEYLIESTMTVGQPLVLAGGKKNLKTNILLDAGISIASQTDFLGKLVVNRKAPVGVMTGESGLATIQETARRICYEKGLRLRDLKETLIFSPDIPRVDNLEHLTALENFIKRDGLEVLAIDPAYLALPGDDAGNLFKQGEILRELNRVCGSCGVTLILCHHTKKNIADPFKPPELEDIAWAGFQEFARQWWMLARRQPYKPGTGFHELWLSIGGSAGHSSLWASNINEGVYDGKTPRVWKVEMLTAADAREAAKKGQAEERAAKSADKWNSSVKECAAAIEAAMMQVDQHTAARSTIQARSGKKGKAFDEAFGELLRRGKLKETTVTKGNNQEYAVFKYQFEGAK